MVDPIYLIIIALVSAFSLGLLKKAGATIQASFAILALLLMTLISGQWSYATIVNGLPAYEITTAGLKAPFSINLLMGKAEAILTLIINLSALMSTIYVSKCVKEKSVYLLMLLLVFTLGLNGVVLTRDLFNLFVFIEVASIASAGLIALKDDVKQLSAGFKYVIAGALASALMLIGIIFNYYVTGSLNIDVIANNMDPALASVGFVGLFLMFIGIIIELKPFPVNGWGIDAYEASVPAVSALVASATATAMFYAFTKIMAVTGGIFLDISVTLGMITFVGSNIAALKQKSARRLLGYSSIAQMGLVVASYSALTILHVENVGFIVLGILLSHALAKAILFWLTGVVDKESIEDWGVMRKSITLLIPMAIAIFALLGLPPFPSFFAKWDLVFTLVAKGNITLVVLILIGSLLEATYLMRWFGYAVKNAIPTQGSSNTLCLRAGTIIPIATYSVLLIASGYMFSLFSSFEITINWIISAFVIALFFVEWLPAKVKNIITIAAVSYYGIPFVQNTAGYRVVFALIFIAGAVITLLPGFVKKGKRLGFYPVTAMMFVGLIGIIEAKKK